MTVDELTAAMISKIDQPLMAAYYESGSNSTWNKFFDFRRFARESAEKALLLKLNSGGKWHLDVGCAFGYLCLASECLGNKSVGIDIPHELLHNVCSANQICYVPFRLAPHETIKMMGKFDLITMIGVNLVRKDGTWWNESDYRFLIDEDFLRRLNSGGTIHIEFNRGPENEFLKQIDWGHRFERNDNIIRIFS